jgi:predicted DsbA family dithiol-disulfide isomerase
MLAQLRQTASRLGLPFGERHMTFNSRRAQELGKWAESEGRGRAFHQAVFRAYFADGLNIAQLPVLKGITEAIGLSSHEAQSKLDAGDYRQAVDRDWQRSRSMGITAVPTFNLNGRQLVGAQPYAALADLVSQSYQDDFRPGPKR